MTTLLPQLTNKEEQQMSRMLRMQYLCCKLFVSNCLSDGRECLWDNFLPDFEEILHLAQSIMDGHPGEGEDGGHGVGFSLDTGLIPPTYFVVLKCRDPKIWRQALDVLRARRQQEGARNSLVAAKMGEAIVELEERRVAVVERASDVPECNRLYQAWYDLWRQERQCSTASVGFSSKMEGGPMSIRNMLPSVRLEDKSISAGTELTDTVSIAWRRSSSLPIELHAQCISKTALQPALQKVEVALDIAIFEAGNVKSFDQLHRNRLQTRGQCERVQRAVEHGLLRAAIGHRASESGVHELECTWYTEEFGGEMTCAEQ